MKKYFGSLITLAVAITGFVGGLLWGFSSHWEWEPIILLVGSFFHVIGNVVTIQTSESDSEIKKTTHQNINNMGSVGKQVNINKNKGDINI